MKHQQLELQALVIIWMKRKLRKLWRTDFDCSRLNTLGYGCWFIPYAKRQCSSQDTHSHPTFCRHSSSKSSLLLLFGLIPNVLGLFHNLCALHPDHNTIKPWQTLAMSKTLPLHWRYRFSTTVSESFKTKLCHSISSAIPWVLRLPLHSTECSIFVPVRLSFLSAALPSVVFLGMSSPHSHLFFPPKQQTFWDPLSPHLYDFHMPSFYQLRFLSNDLTPNAAGLSLIF